MKKSLTQTIATLFAAATLATNAQAQRPAAAESCGKPDAVVSVDRLHRTVSANKRDTTFTPVGQVQLTDLDGVWGYENTINVNRQTNRASLFGSHGAEIVPADSLTAKYTIATPDGRAVVDVDALYRDIRRGAVKLQFNAELGKTRGYDSFERSLMQRIPTTYCRNIPLTLTVNLGSGSSASAYNAARADSALNVRITALEQTNTPATNAPREQTTPQRETEPGAGFAIIPPQTTPAETPRQKTTPRSPVAPRGTYTRPRSEPRAPVYTTRARPQLTLGGGFAFQNSESRVPSGTYTTTVHGPAVYAFFTKAPSETGTLLTAQGMLVNASGSHGQQGGNGNRTSLTTNHLEAEAILARVLENNFLIGARGAYEGTTTQERANAGNTAVQGEARSTNGRFTAQVAGGYQLDGLRALAAFGMRGRDDAQPGTNPQGVSTLEFTRQGVDDLDARLKFEHVANGDATITGTTANARYRFHDNWGAGAQVTYSNQRTLGETTGNTVFGGYVTFTFGGNRR